MTEGNIELVLETKQLVSFLNFTYLTYPTENNYISAKRVSQNSDITQLQVERTELSEGSVLILLSTVQ